MRVTKWLTIGLSLSGSVTARIQKSIPVKYVRFRVHPRVIVQIHGRSAYCRAGDPRIAARLPAENLCGMSVEKGKLSVSSTVCE